MNAKNMLLMLTAFAFLLSAGCLTVSYDATQKFKDDGTSTLSITEFTGMDKQALQRSSYYSIGNTDDPSSVMLNVVLDYYSSYAHASDMCSMMSGVTCTPQNDGSVKVDTTLAPDDFYSYETSTDWVNLKETRTYSIEKVPFASYYAMKGRTGSQYTSAMQQKLGNYVAANAGKYFTKDLYCTASYSNFGCNVAYKSGNSVTFEINSSSYSTYNVSWVGCSRSKSTAFSYYITEAQAKEKVVSAATVNQEITDGSDPISVAVQCPSDAQTLVIAYQYESYAYDYTSGTYGTNLSTSIETFDLATKEKMAQQVLEKFNSTYGTGSYTSYYSSSSGASTDSADYFINFRKGRILGKTFDELATAGSSASLVGMNLNINYVAEFPAKVVSATVGGEKLSVANNKVELALGDMQDLPKGTMQVVSETEISPLGVLTWGIPIVLLIAVGGFMVVMRRP